jgi:hypothetical protein
MTLPTVPESFYWTLSPCGPVLTCRPLEGVSSHVFTTRELQLSAADAWRRVGDLLDVSEVVTVNQVHGREVVTVRRETGQGIEQVPPQDADALVTNDSDIAIGIRAADCVPLLMADKRSGAVAAVHAEWRGTAAGVAVAAVHALAQEFGSKPGELVVAIGPSIGPCCYEVGTELVDAFAAAGHPRHLIDRWFLALPPQRGSRERPRLRLDVAGANRDQLMLAGVPEESIYACGLCTAMHLDVLMSYRAEKEKAGRMAGIIRARG